MRNDKGKRMELGRAAGSGPFPCFLKHRGKNVAILGGEGRWAAGGLYSVRLQNTAAEAFKEERMNASGHVWPCAVSVWRAHKRLN